MLPGATLPASQFNRFLLGSSPKLLKNSRQRAPSVHTIRQKHQET
jgi:hypothetical protein